MRKPGITAISLLVVASIAVSCGQEDFWFIDIDYSAHLLGSAKFYELRTGEEAADTVDAVQVFRTTIDDAALFAVEDIRSKEWIYETSNKNWIKSFFNAARQDAGDQCVASQAPDVLHILAYDRDLMRVGYFKYYPCPGGDVGALSPFGTSSLYFSRPLAQILRPWSPDGSILKE